MVINRSVPTMDHDDSSSDDEFYDSCEDIKTRDYNCPIMNSMRIISIENHALALNEGLLKSILLRDDVADKKVAIISVAGALRKGKSFLLNFLLRYLRSDDKDQWLIGQQMDQRGFPWSGGSDVHTTGILMWPEPFFVTVPSGEEIYNLMHNIQENDLQVLQYFTEYGRMALDMDETFQGTPPFQNLTFLVRDWPSLCDANYGFGGGRKFLKKRLQISESQHLELKDVRRHIQDCFTNIDCFLMPYPGTKVATGQFSGRLADIAPEFLEYLDQFVPQWLFPHSLVLKKINGEFVTARCLVQYLQSYVQIFQGSDLPKPMTLYEANAKAGHSIAVEKAVASYKQAMKKCGCDSDDPLEPAAFEILHQVCSEDAMAYFNGLKKIGADKYGQQSQKRLDALISYERSVFKNANDEKIRLKKERDWEKTKGWIKKGLIWGANLAVAGVSLAAAVYFPALALVLAK